VLKLCFEAHRPDGLVWSVWHGGRWHAAAQVIADGVLLETVYRGPAARQPKAYLTTRQRVAVDRHGETLVIRPAVHSR
jgi:hypothetical protein